MEENIKNEGQSSEIEKSSGDDSGKDNAGSGQVSKETQTGDRLKKIFHISLLIIIPILAIFFFLTFILYFVPVLQELKSGPGTEISSNPELKKDAGYNKQIGALVKDIQRLSRKYNTYSTGQSYIVINTTENRFYLYKNKKLIREGSCSTGSYKKLLTAEGRSWTFKTPRGKFTIQGKRTNPAWHKPDWAFIEEGVPVPPKDSPLRWEAGVLGDYAMDLGDSYMIHGTIYKRFLGMPVTHGCVRLNDEDLEVVFNTLNIGSKVYIY
jgi:lipoprotein-anchoring transpeptidase ErfK/SrfK